MHHLFKTLDNVGHKRLTHREKLKAIGVLAAIGIGQYVASACGLTTPRVDTTPSSTPRTPDSTVTLVSTATRTEKLVGPIEDLPDVAYPPEKLAQDAIAAYARAYGLESTKVELTYKEMKDKDGKPFVVAITSDGIPLLIIKKDGNEKWVWRKVYLKDFGLINVGTLLVVYTYNRNKTVYNEFNSASIGYDLQWANIEPQQGKHIFTKQPDNAHTNSEEFIDFAIQNGMVVMGSSLTYPDGYPKWLKSGGFSREQLM